MKERAETDDAPLTGSTATRTARDSLLAVATRVFAPADSELATKAPPRDRSTKKV
jgi:hypothetical protein